MRCYIIAKNHCYSVTSCYINKYKMNCFLWQCVDNRNNSAVSVLSANNLVNHSSDTTIYL